MKLFTRITALLSLLFISACHMGHPPSAISPVQATHVPSANTLTINEAHQSEGSKKVSVHAYSYTRGSDFCSRTVAIEFQQRSMSYTQTLVALETELVVTGANALSITGWNEHHAGHTTLSAHFFDCHSIKG